MAKIKDSEEEPRRKVTRTQPFVGLVKEFFREHKELETDLVWLEGRLAVAATRMGDHVPGLKGLNLPVYKTRLKDACCQMSTKEGWRLYYAASNETKTVYMLFLHHKHELENPGRKFLQQKIQKAFAAGV